ncbi:MAG: flagellar assembly protein FliW [Armatimonadota bacterium]|nr:flagellar assembly protein FliW [bacterium]MCS7309474.1 flagellar assembly protein FliW [Armatimonadota bacterium]MDW8105492.1 flagellar assembly protein FliW [Armatimonadota bacterium]MDW8291043.1 flagellar assembly protein FliW [Armatimonadota bacterium]
MDKTCIESTRFGRIEVDEEAVITFSQGLFGFEEYRRFVVLCLDEKSPFRWLQSLEEPGLAFVVIEPRHFMPDYAPTISDADVEALQLREDTPYLTFVIVTIPPGKPEQMTANLMGPIIINAATRMARQVIVEDECYSTKHSILQELMKAQPQATEGSHAGPDAQGESEHCHRG